MSDQQLAVTDMAEFIVAADHEAEAIDQSDILTADCMLVLAREKFWLESTQSSKSSRCDSVLVCI